MFKIIKDNDHNHSIYDLGLSGLAMQYLSYLFLPFICKFFKNPNLVTTLNIFIAFGILICLIFNLTIISGILIFVALFFDLLDGNMARFLKMTSQKGKILDSLADILLWLLTIMGIFFLTNYFLLFLILVIYTFDVYIRNIILLESLKNDDKDQQMSEASIILKVFKIVFNHFDSLSILAFCLIFFPDYILYWVYFETIRRSLSAFKRLSILMTHA